MLWWQDLRCKLGLCPRSIRQRTIVSRAVIESVQSNQIFFYQLKGFFIVEICNWCNRSHEKWVRDNDLARYEKTKESPMMSDSPFTPSPRLRWKLLLVLSVMACGAVVWSRL